MDDAYWNKILLTFDWVALPNLLCFNLKDRFRSNIKVIPFWFVLSIIESVVNTGYSKLKVTKT